MISKFEMKEKKGTFQFVLISTVLISMLAHGYRYLNTIYSHDSLYNLLQNDDTWQISLGRFLEPMAMAIRGDLCPTWLISCIAMFMYALSIYLIVDLIEIKNKVLIILTEAILICSICITMTNAAFLHCVDVFAFALFFAVAGIWLANKQRIWSFLAGMLSIAFCLGLYQAYVDVAIVLVLLLVMRKLMNQPSFKETVLYVFNHCGCLFMGAITYVGLWKLVQAICKVGTADSYNGLSSVGNYEGYSIVAIIVDAYKVFLNYFRNMTMFSTNAIFGISMSSFWMSMIEVFTVLAGIVILYGLVYLNLKRKTVWWSRCLQFFVAALFPLAANFVFVMSKGMEHALMIFSFHFFYVFAIMMVSDIQKEKEEKQVSYQINTKIVPAVTMLAILIPVWCNVVFSNQMYLKEELQQSATLSLMTRIVYDIEQVEEYEPGVTPVFFWGYVQDQQSYITMPGFEEISILGVSDSPITYHGLEKYFFNYFMSYDVNVVNTADILDCGVEDFPVYPEKGSIQMVNGVLVVKLSN